MRQVKIAMKILSVMGTISALATLMTGCGMHYSDGERSGFINKISKKGIFWKTWEGSMRIGGMVNGEGSMQTETWEFTVPDESLIAQINASIDSGKKTTLSYSQDIYFFSTHGDTNHFITGVK